VGQHKKGLPGRQPHLLRRLHQNWMADEFVDETGASPRYAVERSHWQ